MERPIFTVVVTLVATGDAPAQAANIWAFARIVRPTLASLRIDCEGPPTVHASQIIAVTNPEVSLGTFAAAKTH